MNMNDIPQILKSNRDFKEDVLKIAQEFIDLRSKFLQECPDFSIDPQQSAQTTERFKSFSVELIRQHTINQGTAITVYGANSSGKTAFIQHFLQIGEILPSDVGPVTTRIVKLTYSSADQAYACVFSSLDDCLAKKQPVVSIALNEFFANPNEPDWDLISDRLHEHLARPEDIGEEKFAEWSRHFIEIGLPSPILQLGIDLYDTPGYLSNGRDEILNQNLYQLVKLIQPILLFLYENPAVSETDQLCFLSLKQALGSLENVPIFFLNTKADVINILKNEGISPTDNVSKEIFEEALRESRIKRYNELLKHDVIASEIIGGLPSSIDECDCFDICAVPHVLMGHLDLTDLMNEGTFRRIILFGVRSEGNVYQGLVDKILSSIDEYFDLVLSAAYRTEGQWDILRNHAINWANRFFAKVKETFPTIIETIHTNILDVFDRQKESIAMRAGSRTCQNDSSNNLRLSLTSNKVRDFVQIAVYEEVLKVAASESMRTSLAQIDQMSNDDILNDRKRNELLSMAKRHIQFWEISGEDLSRKKFLAIILQHLVRAPHRISRMILSLRTRPYLDWYKEHADEYDLLDALDNFANLTNESRRQQFARDYLTNMRTTIVKQRALFEQNLFQWIETKQVEFFARIENGYRYAITNMQKCREAHKVTEKYSDHFAMLECQLIAAKNLLHFNGLKPKVHDSHLLGAGGFFNIHAAEWGNQGNLAVKRQRSNTLVDYPYAAYVEAHYHRAITNTRQANVVPLSYLYFHRGQLFIFMPKYKQSLQKYLQENIRKIKFDQVCSFALTIANVLHDIHANELVHRDIKSSNILLDQDDQCYLSDFGTGKEGALNTTVIGTLPLPPEIFANAINPYSVTIYDGKAVDIYAYGILLYELLPKKEYHRPNQELAGDPVRLLANEKIYPISPDMNDYKQLIIDCLQRDAADRPRTSTIIQRLNVLVKLSEIKSCTLCLERPRTVRTYPCGHKVLCQTCRDDLRRRNYDLCVVCKKIMQKDVHDNVNQTFHMQLKSN